MQILDIKDDILQWVMGAVRIICAWLSSFVYEIMAWTFELLFKVSRIRLLNRSVCEASNRLSYITTNSAGATILNEDMCTAAGGVWTQSPITLIYQRITLLLAIIMVFFITFQFIKYLIEPEQIADKEKGVEKLGFKLLTVVALLALVPTIFDKAYDLQNEILKSQFLAKIVLGTEIEDAEYFGRDFSANFLSHFYYFEKVFASKYTAEQLAQPGFQADEKDCDGLPCNQIVLRTISDFKTYGTLDTITWGLAAYNNDKIYYIHFDSIICLAAGVLIMWMLIKYTIDVGARVIQLTFLQVIAPIPIISYLSPKKDGTFQKWVKQCTTTYLDLFIRLSIVFFVMLLIEGVDKAFEAKILIDSGDDKLEFYIYIILILGLITFCGRVPKMIEELFPSMGVASGSLGLKPQDGFKRLINTATGAATGAAIGLLGGRGVGKISGALGGIFRGASTGVKSKDGVFKNIGAVGKKQSDWNAKKIQRHNDGSTFFGRQRQRAANIGGWAGPAERDETKVSKIEREIKTKQGEIAERKRQVSTLQTGNQKFKNYKDIIDGEIETGTFNATSKGGPAKFEEARRKQIALNGMKNRIEMAKSGNAIMDEAEVQRRKEKLEAARARGESAEVIAKLQTSYDRAKDNKGKKYDYTSEELAEMQLEYEDQKKAVRKDIANMIQNGEIENAKVKDARKQLEDFINADKTGAYTEGVNEHTKFEDLKSLDDDSRNKSTSLNEKVLEAESEINKLEDEKTEITSTKKYATHQANRNAVGGQTGKK